MKFNDFLIQQYLDWQKTDGEIKTQLDFAAYLDVKQSTLSTWMSGERRPQGDNVHKLASKLGPEVYDALGLERPNPHLSYITSVFDQLPPEAQEKLADDVEQYLNDNERVLEEDHRELSQVDGKSTSKGRR